MVLNLFLKTPDAKAVIDVGCCYHCYIEEDGRMGLPGEHGHLFPISKTVNELEPNLSNSALKNATFATVQFAELNSDHPTVSASTLAYRSIVEIVFARHFKDVDYRIKKINAKHYINFETYLNQIGSKLSFRDANKNWVKGESEVDSWREEFLQAYKDHSRGEYQLRVWTALQMVIVPVIESLLLIDRLLYLEESAEVEASIVPLFDAKLSPRNMAVVAIKQ